MDTLKKIEQDLRTCADRFDATGCPVSAARLRRIADRLAKVQPEGWRIAAHNWLMARAERQDENNRRWPDHAKCYVSWQWFPRIARNLAHDVTDPTTKGTVSLHGEPEAAKQEGGRNHE